MTGLARRGGLRDEVEVIPAEGQRRKIRAARAGGTRVPRVSTGSDRHARELILMAAHDLRAPLATIQMQAQALDHRWLTGRDVSDADLAAANARISRAVASALTLIDDLLAVERLKMTARHPLGSKAIDVQAVVREVIALNDDVLRRAGCQVRVVREKGLATARGPWDRVLMQRVFSNLLRNTARHAPGAPVQILLARRGDSLRIVFADRGPGLPLNVDEPAAQQRGSDRDTGESHGFGLWIVRRAIDGLNGRLRTRNVPGRGVAFDIELPGLQEVSPR
jgi:signal transduction histidine kinase